MLPVYKSTANTSSLSLSYSWIKTYIRLYQCHFSTFDIFPSNVLMPVKYREVALIVGAVTPNVDTSGGGMLQICSSCLMLVQVTLACI